MKDQETRPSDDDAARIVFVTGPSGAGRSTAIRALEDLGFEAIDNLPLSMLPALLDGPPPTRPLVLGTDPRNRDFSSEALLQAVDRVQGHPDLLADLIFLDCAKGCPCPAVFRNAQAPSVGPGGSTAPRVSSWNAICCLRSGPARTS